MDKELDEALKALYQPGIDGNTGKMMRRVAVLSDGLRSSLSTIRAQEEEIAGLKAKLAQNHDWYCGCGHWNSSNIDQCAACARHPGEQR